MTRGEHLASRGIAAGVDVLVGTLLGVPATWAGVALGLSPAAAAWLATALVGAAVVVPEARTGRTLGKAVGGLRVVAGGRRRPGWVRAIARWAPRLAVFAAAGTVTSWRPALIGLLLVDHVWPVVAPSRRTLHDLVAGTRVVVDRVMAADAGPVARWAHQVPAVTRSSRDLRGGG